MAKYLTDRQDRKLEEMARKLDGLVVQNNRFNASLRGTGTDFGTPIVPRTSIPAATRIVQAGSDIFTPGKGTAYLFRVATGGEIEPRVDNDGAVIFKDVYNLSTQAYEPNNAEPTTDYIGPNTDILYAHMDRSGKLFIPADNEGMANEAHLGTIRLGWLAPILSGGSKYYQDDGSSYPSAGAPDTNWALMDGISNVSPGSGIAMWDRGGGDSDPFFLRAKDAIANCDNTAAGRTVPPGDPDVDEVQLQDHLDHTHNVLDLCERQYVKGVGNDPKLCQWDLVGGNCETECVSTVRDASDCTAAAPVGVLEHTFVNGQASAVENFEVTMPNKKLHFFERVA